MRATDAVKVVLLPTAMLLAACGGGDEDSSDNDSGRFPLPPLIHTVGGTISGLAGTGLMLQINRSGSITILDNGDFNFASSLAIGATYSITVLAQPTGPRQTCIVNGGSGTITGDDVTTVAITCTTDRFTIGGAVTGLASAGLVLQNNRGGDLSISTPGTFVFADPVESGSSYEVTILTQPSVGPTQNCVVYNGTGTVTSTAVTDVTVTCTLSITSSIYAAAARTFLLAAHGASGAASVFAAEALTGMMPVTH